MKAAGGGGSLGPTPWADIACCHTCLSYTCPSFLTMIARCPHPATREDHGEIREVYPPPSLFLKIPTDLAFLSGMSVSLT